MGINSIIQKFLLEDPFGEYEKKGHPQPEKGIYLKKMQRKIALEGIIVFTLFVEIPNSTLKILYIIITPV